MRATIVVDRAARAPLAALLGVVMFVLLAALGAGGARADDDDDKKVENQGRIVIDRVTVTPSRLGLARVRALISAVELNGKRIAVVPAGKGGPTIKLGGAKTSDAMIGAFEASDAELAVVLVVPVSSVTFEYDEQFAAMREHLKAELLTPLGKLGPRVQVAVLGYAETLTGSSRLGNVAAAIAKLEGLEIDSSPPNLLAAVQRAHALVKNAVKKPRNPGALVRGVVVLVSDGKGVSLEERSLVPKLGLAAHKDLVRIHSLGYSPAGRKRPLFALGELSRQSRGTFRWVRTADGWKDRLGQLVDELKGQTVLTLFAPAEELADKKLVVVVPLAGKGLESEAIKLPAATCGGEACDGYCHQAVCVMPLRAKAGGALRWILIGGGGVVALIVGVVGVSLLRRRRQQPGGPPPPMMFPGAPPIATQAPVAAPAPGAPVLMILSGPQTGARLPLRHGFTIGKAPGSDLDLSHDGYASTNHAIITFEGGVWTLLDRGSTNGTFANGARVTQVRLDPTVTVRLGSTDVRFWNG